jgi:hypothetical protein
MMGKEGERYFKGASLRGFKSLDFLSGFSGFALGLDCR